MQKLWFQAWVPHYSLADSSLLLNTAALAGGRWSSRQVTYLYCTAQYGVQSRGGHWMRMWMWKEPQKHISYPWIAQQGHRIILAANTKHKAKHCILLPSGADGVSPLSRPELSIIDSNIAPLTSHLALLPPPPLPPPPTCIQQTLRYHLNHSSCCHHKPFVCSPRPNAAASPKPRPAC